MVKKTYKIIKLPPECMFRHMSGEITDAYIIKTVRKRRWLNRVLYAIPHEYEKTTTFLSPYNYMSKEVAKMMYFNLTGNSWQTEESTDSKPLTNALTDKEVNEIEIRLFNANRINSDISRLIASHRLLNRR